MNTVEFTKMVGTGNDFIVVDDRAEVFPIGVDVITRLCARQTGIGADGVMLVQKSSTQAFKMRIFNADGSEAEMCGNGARCISLFARLMGIVDTDMFSFETIAGTIKAELTEDFVSVQLSDPEDVKFDNEIKVDGKDMTVHFLNTGVPHAVVFTDDVEDMDIAPLGASIRYHEFFAPAGTNVNFAKKLDENKIAVRTYERGVENETLACGTGMSASAIAAYTKLGVAKPVLISTRGGDELSVDFDVEGDEIKNVMLCGAAKVVFSGVVNI